MTQRPSPHPGPALLADAHATGAGYLDSPRDGTVADLVHRIADLERQAGVRVVRRLGVSIEHAAALAAVGDDAAWGTSWFDRTVPSMRSTVLVTDRLDLERTLAAFAGAGARWACLGSSLTLADARRLVATAEEHGLGIAIEPGPAFLAALDERSLTDRLRTTGTAEALVDGLVPDATDRHRQRMLLALARLDGHLLEDRLARLADARIPITPLLLATRRRADLASAVEAPGLERLVQVLPYHRRIQALRAPGALRMGRREAMAHLGLVALDRAQARELQVGWERLQQAAVRLAGAGVPFVGGSGAPGLGMAPGSALGEEHALWRRLDFPAARVDAAFAATVARSPGPIEVRR